MVPYMQFLSFVNYSELLLLLLKRKQGRTHNF